MTIYVITYHLKEKTNHHDDYKITKVIKSLGSWAHFMPNNFLLRCESNSQAITEKIKEILDAGDLLFVAKVSKDDFSSLTPEVIEWINR